MTWIETAAISGFRGFAGAETLELARPNGKKGSGLTILVGPNNGGKSSVLEAIKVVAATQQPEFTTGMRNSKAGGVRITLSIDNGSSVTVETLGNGYQSRRVPQDTPLRERVYYVPPRRAVERQFGAGRARWAAHADQSAQLQPNRATFTPLPYRLVDVAADTEAKARFDAVLKRLLGEAMTWNIDKEDNGQHVLMVDSPTGRHSSDGAGFGILSVLYLADALTEQPGTKSILIIDEPEVSLHPQLQDRLLELLLEHSQESQVILGTHSPRLVDVTAIAAGARVARVAPSNHGCIIRQLGPAARDAIAASVTDLNNPHWFGTEAREVFFADGQVLITEGQEDVVLLRRLCAERAKTLRPRLFGWGAGGAERMRLICEILSDLGLEQVIGLLDGDKSDLANELQGRFPSFRFFVLPAPDIRDKPGLGPAIAKRGLASTVGEVHAEYVEPFDKLIDDINGAFE